jgi:hypothetical protein
MLYNKIVLIRRAIALLIGERKVRTPSQTDLSVKDKIIAANGRLRQLTEEVRAETV